MYNEIQLSIVKSQLFQKRKHFLGHMSASGKEPDPMIPERTVV